MVNLIKQGSSLIVTSDQAFPWESGKITLPMNSLYFIIDESDAVVFRSVANSDIIFNALLKDLQIDSTQATKDNLVQLFDSVGNAPMGGGSSPITIDSALSETSENPVQNKVITEALNTKVTSEELTNAISGVEAKIPDVSNKQDILVNQVNIKSINGQTLLGEGNITIEGGGSSVTVDDNLNLESINPVQNKIITRALNEKVESIQLTQKEYDELVEKDPKIMYVITDAPELEDNVFDATPLFEASQKPQDKTVSEAFQTAILAAISEKKVMVIHNSEVNVVVTFAQKKDSSVMFTATNNMQLFYIQLNTVTREVSIEQKAVGTGTFDKYSNEQNHSIFDLTRESTNNDIQVAFSTNENGVKIPDVGDVVEVKDIDENITDSAIVISHISTADNIDLIFVKNNIVDDFIVTFNLKINYNAAQGFDSMRVLRTTHYEINPALITDAEMQALKGKIENKQDKLIGTEVEGQNLKTINGQSLLGTGNIVVSGGGEQGGAVDSVNGQTGNVTITAADLDVYTKGEVDAKGFLTSIPDEYTTDAELSAALAGKADVSALNKVSESATNAESNAEKANLGVADNYKEIQTLKTSKADVSALNKVSESVTNAESNAEKANLGVADNHNEIETLKTNKADVSALNKVSQGLADLQNEVSTIGLSIPTKTSQLKNDSNFVNTKVTDALEQSINDKADASAIVDMATQSWVNQQINTAISGVENKINEINNKII